MPKRLSSMISQTLMRRKMLTNDNSADRVAINAIKPNKREAEASVINAEKAVK